MMGTSGAGGAMGAAGETAADGNAPVCLPDQVRCSNNRVETCAANGQWAAARECTNQTCFEGECQGECSTGQTRCTAGGVQRCDVIGRWEAAVPCADETPVCIEGACVAPRSCEDLPATCGSGESCCVSPTVTGGAFNRHNDPSYPARVSTFRLDKYEVTVGRFRQFVNAVVDGWHPSEGAGKHVHLNDGQGLANSGSGEGFESGWNPAWDDHLHSAKATWDGETSLDCYGTSSWTPEPGANETRPIGCVSWYQAYGFCIWDGGFLPSEAEWNYAAVGGGEHRTYPWGETAPGTNALLAIHGCYYNGSGSCGGISSLAPVGSAPAGNGRFGQADLAGNVAEWALDNRRPSIVGCTDCAWFSDETLDRPIYGGNYISDAESLSLARQSTAGTSRTGSTGFRCARSP